MKMKGKPMIVFGLIEGLVLLAVGSSAIIWPEETTLVLARVVGACAVAAGL